MFRSKNWLTRCPTLLGLLRSFCLWYPSQPQVRLVDQAGVSSNKTERPAVSANDILTSHLLMLSGFGVGYMSINLRDRGLGVTSINAGNYVHRVHLRPDDFSEPAQVRKALSRYFTGGCDEVPDCWSSMVTRHGLVSNWAGLHHEALILKFVLQPATDLAKTLQEVRSAVGRFEAPDLPMYILRPGTSEEQGWLWVLGLNPHILRHLRGILLQASQEDPASGTSQGLKLASFLQVLTCMPRRKSKLLTALRAAFTYLDKQLRPCEVAPRLTLASYWHSNEVVRRTQCGSRSGWIVLAGDAACGKPFYFGSNLNGHFQDAVALLSVPWSQLPSQGEPGSQARAEEEPFKRYAAEYRRRIAESRGFHTSKTSASAKETGQSPVHFDLAPESPIQAPAAPQQTLAKDEKEERQQAEKEVRDLKATIAELEERLQQQDEQLQLNKTRQQELSDDLEEARRAAQEHQQAAAEARQHIEKEVTSPHPSSSSVSLRVQQAPSPVPECASLSPLQGDVGKEPVHTWRHPAGEVFLSAVQACLPTLAASPASTASRSPPQGRHAHRGILAVPEEAYKANPSQHGGIAAHEAEVGHQHDDRLRALEKCMEETRRQLEVCLETAARSRSPVTSPVQAREEPTAVRVASPERGHGEASPAGHPCWSECPTIEVPDAHLQACLLLRSRLANTLDPPELLQKAQAMLRLKVIQWHRLVLFWGFLAVARAQSVYCRVEQLRDLEGEISGVGEPLGSSRESSCAWHIIPSLSLQAIEFTLLGDGSFSGYDALVIYGSGQVHSSTRVATFHRGNPLPAAMALTGTSEALLVLSAARRFRDSEAAQVEEQQALPLEMWKDRELEVGKRSNDECCLCLEPYTEEDMLRVLPCRHFFHQACIDHWFSANRFMPRSCPLCKADPTAMQPPSAWAPAMTPTKASV
eukprot:s3244_g7.t3